MKKVILLIFLLFTTLSISAERYHWKDINSPFDSLTRQAEWLSKNEADFHEMLPLIQQMYRMVKQNNENKIMLSRAMFWDIWANSRKDENHYYAMIDKTIEIMDTVRYSYDYHRLLMIKQAILSNRGDFLPAYMLASKLASYFKEVGDQISWAYCMGNISNIFTDLNEFSEAEAYAEKASAIFEEYGMKGKMLLIRLNLATIYNRLRKREKAMNLLKPIVENFPSEANQKIRLLYLISYCDHLQNNKEKEFYIEKTYQSALDYSDPYYIQVATLNKGILFYQKNQHDSAQLYLNKIKTNLKHDPNPIIKEKTFNLLSLLFAGQAQYDSAYYYNVLHQEYMDSLKGVNVLLEVHRIKIRKDIDNYRSQLEQSKLEAKGQKRLVILILCVFIIILSFSAIVFRLLIKRAAMEKKLREVESKEYHERIRNEQLIIDSQNRELSSNTILLTKKNLVLKGLLQQLEELENEGKLNSRTGKSLKSSIEVTLREDDEWEYFKIHFEQVHPDFFIKLKNTFPELTDNELRLCAYSRLNLSIKQIAQMLSVQPKTIVQARYRMRKKMNLENEELLNDFLRNY